MYLFAAISRANKIPARCLGGYVVKENSILKPSDYHNWSEFFDNGLWRLSDPQKRNFDKNASNYIAFKVFNNPVDDQIGSFHRFRCAGDGMKVKMNG